MIRKYFIAKLSYQCLSKLQCKHMSGLRMLPNILCRARVRGTRIHTLARTQGIAGSLARAEVIDGCLAKTEGISRRLARNQMFSSTRQLSTGKTFYIQDASGTIR